MPHPSDRTFLVLHAVKVRGFAEDFDIAEAFDLDLIEVRAILNVLCEQGLVSLRTGRVSGWRTTPAGSAAHAELLPADVCHPAVREAVDDAHGRFVPINGVFKQVCTSWQLRDGAPNDHSDVDYDRTVIGSLHEVHDQVLRTLATLANAVTRFSRYDPRLSAALQRVDSGDRDAFTKPLASSYHDVWMELHQDFILSLGLSRAEADA